MKKASREEDKMRNHYDFRGGVRGQYARRYAEGTNVVVLDQDVAEMFPDRESVNEALRAVGRAVELRERQQAKSNKSTGPDRGRAPGPAKRTVSPSGRRG